MINPRIVTSDSAAGKASHTPVIPHKADRRNARGMINRNPRKIEMICAGSGFSIDVKYTDRIDRKSVV